MIDPHTEPGSLIVLRSVVDDGNICIGAPYIEENFFVTDGTLAVLLSIQDGSVINILVEGRPGWVWGEEAFTLDGESNTV